MLTAAPVPRAPLLGARSDPITEFVRCLFVDYNFDGAQEQLAKCEEVVAGRHTARPDLIDTWQRSPVFHHVSLRQPSAACRPPPTAAACHFACCAP